MKLVYIANARIPSERAHGKQIFKTCIALAKRLDLELWLPNRPQLPQYRDIDPFVYYRSTINFPVRKFPTIDFLNFVNRLPQLAKTFFYVLEEATFLLALALVMPKAEIVYTRSITVAALAKHFWRKKTFYEIHDLTGNALVRRLYGGLLTKLDGVVTISRGLETALRSLRVTKVLVAPDGADLSEFRVEPKLTPPELANPGRRVVYTGGLDKTKGVFTLLEAAKQLTKEKVMVFIAGGTLTLGHDRAVAAYITKNKITNVKFLGLLPSGNIPSLLLAADVLVLPNSAFSVNSRLYTSPMKLFEYLVAGRPIVASATPANKEILEHERNAFLVKPDSAKDLANGILAVLTDKKLAMKISHQAKKDALKYSWDRRAEKIIAFVSLSFRA